MLLKPYMIYVFVVLFSVLV